jgi:hypothetical protein
MFAFAENNFLPRLICSLPMLIIKTGLALGAITKWIKKLRT